jgi:hypothetical protein
MGAINGTNAVLKNHESEITAYMNMHIYLMKEHVLHNYLQEWILSMASKYLWVNGSARRLDHFIPKLTNSIQNLVKMFVHCLNGPSK